MKTIGDEPINTDFELKEFSGLTKREHFASLALQGILSAQVEMRTMGYSNTSHNQIGAIVTEAVQTADALIEALNKEKPCEEKQ